MSDYKRILSEMRDPSLEGYRHSALLDLIGRAADKFASVLYEIERLQVNQAKEKR